MTNRLTKRELEAAIEAILSRCAGEIDIANEPGSPTHDDYENAAQKLINQQTRRFPEKHTGA